MGRFLAVWLALATAAAVLVSLPATAGAATRHGSLCVSRHVVYVEGKIDVHYRPGCTGHDEPELDPVSSLPHSAKNLTWKFILPTDGKFPVAGTGFGFWFGGTVTDPNPKSLFHQGFLEVQFYPDTLVSKCIPERQLELHVREEHLHRVLAGVVDRRQQRAGGVRRDAAQGRHRAGRSSCTPATRSPLHYYGTSAHDGAHIDVADLTTHEHGSIVLRNKRTGAMNPAFDRQEIGNALGWGIVHDAPNSFVWEIGHRSDFSQRPGAFCAPGHNGCESYNWRAWRETSPIQILGVTFGEPRPREALGGRQRLRRQGADPRSQRDRVDLHPLRRSVLHLPVVHAERGRLAHLRRQLPDDRGRLRQGQPVRAAHALRRPVRGEQHLLHDPDPVTGVIEPTRRCVQGR